MFFELAKQRYYLSNVCYVLLHVFLSMVSNLILMKAYEMCVVILIHRWENWCSESQRRSLEACGGSDFRMSSKRTIWELPEALSPVPSQFSQCPVGREHRVCSWLPLSVAPAPFRVKSLHLGKVLSNGSAVVAVLALSDRNLVKT